MKRYFALLIMCCLASCAGPGYVQLYTASPVGSSIKIEKEFLVYENDTVRVAYNFWGEYGAMSFIVFNKLSVPLYINWQESFFVNKKEKKNYYEDAARRKTAFRPAPDAITAFGPVMTQPKSVAANEGLADNAAPQQSLAAAANNPANTGRLAVVPPNGYIYKGTNYMLTDGYLKMSSKQSRQIDFDGQRCQQQLIDPASAAIIFRNFFTYDTHESFDQNQAVDNSFYLSKVITMRATQFGGPAVYAGNNRYAPSMPYKNPDRFYSAYLTHRNIFIKKKADAKYENH